MKKVILSFIAVSVLISILIVSCNKNQEVTTPQTNSLSSKSESQKINIVNADADWKFIASKNLETISKLVNSKIDVNKFDFTSEEGFLKAIGVDKTQYLNDTKAVKAAANRLIAKYNLSSSATGECISCKTNNDESIAKIKRTITLLRENKASFTKFQALLSSPNLNLVDPGDGGCCGWRFYACVTFCAASIEIFPVYLMCCAICYDTYCCH